MEASLAEIPPADSRSPQVIQQLMDATTHTDLFRHLSTLHDSDQVHRNCCQRMQWKRFRDGEELLSFKQTPTMLCWVLTGTVAAFAPQRVVATYELNIPNININKRTLAPAPQPNLQDNWLEETTVKETQYQLGLLQGFYQKEIDEAGTVALSNDETLVEAPALAKRQYFGELGLISTLPSVCSLVAVSNVTAIVLTATDFYTALSEVVEAECSRKVADLSKVALFRSWAKLTLIKLSEFMHLKRFRRNEVVFTENDVADCVYFICSGEFNVRLTQLTLRVGSPTRRRLTANLSIKSPYDILGADEIVERRKTCLLYTSPSPRDS